MSARTEQPLTAVPLEKCRLTPAPGPTLAFMERKKEKKVKLLATLPEGGFAVSMDIVGLYPAKEFTFFDSPEDFFCETANEKRRNFYEIILADKPCTLYFDIDHYTAGKFDKDGSLSDDKLATIIETIRDEAKTRWPSLASAAGASPLDNVVVTTASRFTGEVYKHSFHILFVKIGFSSNYGELKNFATHLKKLDNMQAKNAKLQPTSLIDTNVYNKDQNLRITESWKDNKKPTPEMALEFYPKKAHTMDNLLETLATNVKKVTHWIPEPQVAEKEANLAGVKRARPEKEDQEINNEQEGFFDTNSINTKLRCMISKFQISRSDEYDTWTKMVWCIINICQKSGIGKHCCCTLIHQFSKLSPKYAEDAVTDFFDNNYGKLRENSYGWPYLNGALKIDDPEYYDIITTKMYSLVKQTFELDRAKIRHPPMIIHLNGKGKYVLSTINSCKDSYTDMKCKIPEFDKKTGKTKLVVKQFIFLWLKDSNIRVYDEVVFEPPPLVSHPRTFNTWIPFEISKEPLMKTERDYWKEYCDFLKNVIGDAKIVDYIIARYAFRIMNPATRTNVILIICGNEGDGKNRLLAPIYNIMRGYTCILDNAKKLYGDHSMFEFQKLFIRIDEAGGVANFDNSEILKTRATEPELTVNPKGVQAFEINNMCDYDMTTNNLNVVKMTDDSSRRFLQVETTSYYSNNVKFFNDYCKNIEDNPVALRQIYEGLIKFDYTSIVPSLNFQDVRYKPTTSVGDCVKQQNRDKVIYFFEDWTRDQLKLKFEGDPGPDLDGVPIKYKNATLFTMYQTWCNIAKVKMDFNIVSFGMRITVLTKKQLNAKGFTCVKKDTSNSTTSLYLSEFKRYFTALNGFEFEDDMEGQ
jgi:hypothetical protein